MAQLAPGSGIPGKRGTATPLPSSNPMSRSALPRKAWRSSRVTYSTLARGRVVPEVAHSVSNVPSDLGVSTVPTIPIFRPPHIGRPFREAKPITLLTVRSGSPGRRGARLTPTQTSGISPAVPARTALSCRRCARRSTSPSLKYLASAPIRFTGLLPTVFQTTFPTGPAC